MARNPNPLDGSLDQVARKASDRIRRGPRDDEGGVHAQRYKLSKSAAAVLVRRHWVTSLRRLNNTHINNQTDYGNGNP